MTGCAVLESVFVGVLVFIYCEALGKVGSRRSS